MSQPTRVALYVRISRDSETKGLGVRRQERECREWAARNAWDVIDTGGRRDILDYEHAGKLYRVRRPKSWVEHGVYGDNDITAGKGSDVPRPGYLTLLSAIEKGDIDGILYWNNDRLHRHPRELEDFIDLIEKTGIMLHSLQGGDYDLTTSGGRLSARIVGAVARHEWEIKVERSRSKHAELIRDGKPSGGTRAFGYTPRRTNLVENEAELIRQAARDLLDGRSQRSIINEWNALGIKTTLGNRWLPVVFRRSMTAEYLVARRQGVAASWPPILDEATWRRVCAIFESRKNGRVYAKTLLSGIATCGLCGHVLYSRPKGDGRPCYTCASDLGGCGKIRTLAEPLEDDLLGRLWAVLPAAGVREAGDAVEDDTEAQAAIRRLEKLSIDLAIMLGAGELSPAEFSSAKAANETALAEARSQLVEKVAKDQEEALRLETVNLESRWDGLDIDQKRRYIRSLFKTIVVNPAVKGRNFYVTDRLSVEYNV